MTARPHARPRYEHSDASIRLIAAIAIGLLGVLVLVIILLLAVFPRSAHHEARLSQPNTPEPRLQINEPADLAALRARENAVLNGYGWVDRSQGIAHIPIDAAMRQVARTGIADWPKAP